MRTHLKSLPNALTLARLGLFPFLIFLWPKEPLWAAGVFVAGAATDWLDGALARLLQAKSAFGAFLDPLADKILVASALLLLLGEGSLPAWVCAVVIGRELGIQAMREQAAGSGKLSVLAVNFIAKAKTFMQMLGLGGMLFARAGLDQIGAAAEVAFYLGVILGVLSLGQYARKLAASLA